MGHVSDDKRIIVHALIKKYIPFFVVYLQLRFLFNANDSCFYH